MTTKILQPANHVVASAINLKTELENKPFGSDNVSAVTHLIGECIDNPPSIACQKLIDLRNKLIPLSHDVFVREVFFKINSCLYRTYPISVGGK